MATKRDGKQQPKVVVIRYFDREAGTVVETTEPGPISLYGEGAK